MTTIYFAGAISGGRGDVALYREIIAALEADGHRVLAGAVAAEHVTASGEALDSCAIFDRDLGWIAAARRPRRRGLDAVDGSRIRDRHRPLPLRNPGDLPLPPGAHHALHGHGRRRPRNRADRVLASVADLLPRLTVRPREIHRRPPRFAPTLTAWTTLCYRPPPAAPQVLRHSSVGRATDC